MPRKNITSSIRHGFDYQDLWTLKLCGEWLLNPDKYSWIRIEGNPTEERDFFIEDIVLFDKQGRYHFYQAKFKVDSQYEWGWGDFLEKRKGKKGDLPSLFNKWAASFNNVKEDNIQKAILVTNSDFSDEVKPFLIDCKIDIDKLKAEQPDLHDQIKSEIGTDEFVKAFFDKFEFIYQSKELDEIEKEIINDIFIESLSATSHGVNNLLLQVKREARKAFTVKLTLSQIKGWCEFDIPRPLNESFEVPSDFQFFDETTHKDILKDLHDAKGGIKTIFGKPGTGKSVYLSQLSDTLMDESEIVIKHHYHINPSDSTSFERLNSERVAEAIKAQFKSQDYSKYLGDLANRNSRDIPLREFISSVAANLSKDNKCFVVIIDGLDHVVRERNIQELESFLGEIFYPQKGLWIVFGMQPQVKNETTLQSIFNKIPEDSLIEIKGLNKKAVIELIEQNETGLNLPDDNGLLDSLEDKLWEISQGNPLHLRYILEQLKNRLDRQLITEYECRDLIPYGGDIEKYYESLWGTLGEDEKSFLLIFISVGFQFTRQQFIECVSSFYTIPATISQNFKKVEHLLSSDFRDKLRMFHNSFGVFIYKQKELGEQQKVLKERVQTWLEKSPYENLKWSELRKLQHALGNSEPILEINREWLIDAIVHPRNQSQIKSQLELSSKAAFDKNDFGALLEISHLLSYYHNVQDYVKEAADLIWIQAIKANPDIVDDLILDELPSDALAEVAVIANQKGQFDVIDEIVNVLQDRVMYQEYTVGQVPSDIKAIVNVIPYKRTHKVEKIHKNIVNLRDHEISIELFRIYANKMLALDQDSKIIELLKMDLNEDEKEAILGSCIKRDLKQSTSTFVEFLEPEINKSCLGHIYLILQKRKVTLLPDLPEYSEFPATLPEHGAERGKWAKKYHDYFMTGIIYGLCNEQGKIKDWIEMAPSKWPALASAVLLSAALKIATAIQKEYNIDFKDIFNELIGVPDLEWPVDRDRLEFKYALKDALTYILKNLILIKHFLNGPFSINNNEFKVLTSTPFFLKNDVFELVLDLNQILLEKDVYETISAERYEGLQNTVGTLSERSEHYANLSTFCSLYGDDKKSEELLKKSANNLLGYGYHKDVYLFHVIDSIEFCAKAGLNAEYIDNWLYRVIPLITSVEEYTDGDETSHLQSYLADFLAKYNNRLLFKYYFDEAANEYLYPAQNRFKYVIRSLSFETDVEKALATTALDKDSLKELKEVSNKLDGAKESLGTIQGYLGDINYKYDDYSSQSDFDEKEVNYSEVTPDKLEVYLNSLETKWDFEKYATGWTAYWLEKGNRQEIYELVKSIVLKKSELKSFPGEILDILYPLAYEFDNSDAFSFLCYAQENNHGWSTYWTEKSKAERRWDFLRDKYPSRYIEFFKDSSGYHTAVPRSVEFFLHFGDTKNAQIITEACMEFAEELMADLPLPYPKWAKKDYQDIDEIDLLFQRLVWPSPLVRERSATAIGELLSNSARKEEIYKRLLTWIGKTSIESVIAVGLLPIIKAFQLSDNISDLSFIKISDITDSIRAHSSVIEYLLKEIALLTTEDIIKIPTYLPIKAHPVSYEPDEFFYEHIKTILAPIYLNNSEAIEGKTHLPFIKLWAYNAEQIASDNNIEFNSNHSFYGRHENGRFLTGFSTKVSEVYRSAYLRVLHDFYVKDLIHKDIYLDHAFDTLPVDLSVWKIKPNKPPEWWPTLLEIDEDTKEHKISSIRFKEPLEDLTNYTEDNKVILTAEGVIRPAKGPLEKPLHSFSLIGFGYKVLGPDLPEPKEVSKKYYMLRKHVFLPQWQIGLYPSWKIQRSEEHTSELQSH